MRRYRRAYRWIARAILLASMPLACGGAAGPGAEAPREVTFGVLGSTQQSGHDSPDAALLLDAQAVSLLGQGGVTGDRLAIAVLQGQQRTGGYAVKVDRIVRVGSRLEVHASFAEPPADAIVIQVLTSPAQVVSVARADITGVDTVVLLDESGAERASAQIR